MFYAKFSFIHFIYLNTHKPPLDTSRVQSVICMLVAASFWFCEWFFLEGLEESG